MTWTEQLQRVMLCSQYAAFDIASLTAYVLTNMCGCGCRSTYTHGFVCCLKVCYAICGIACYAGTYMHHQRAFCDVHKGSIDLHHLHCYY